MDSGGASAPVPDSGAGTSNLASVSMAGFNFTDEQARNRDWFLKQYALLKHHNMLGILDATEPPRATSSELESSSILVPRIQMLKAKRLAIAGRLYVSSISPPSVSLGKLLLRTEKVRWLQLRFSSGPRRSSFPASIRSSRARA